MLRMTSLALAIIASLFAEALAAEETFDTNFMFGGMKGVKDSHYQFTDDAPIAGEYNLDVYVNNKWRGKYDLTVKEQPGKAACHTPSCSSSVLKPRGWTKRIWRNASRYARLCRGKYHFDISTLTLELTVPQAFVNELEAGYASPESWDRGVNAFYTSYYASQYYSDYKSAGNNKSTFARFTSGLNLLGWQLHSDASYNNNDSGAGEWKSNTLYLERGFGEIESTLRAGDMYTSGDIFDTVRFRGVRLYRDMQMLPNSRRNFTPIVQGLRKAMPWSPLSKMAL